MTNNGALSLHLGLCGALGDGPRYLPCAERGDPALTDEPEVLMADAASDATPVQSGSRNTLFDPNMQERKDEIDALRARVDVILNKMVQNSGDDVQRLRQKIAEMRTGTPQPGSKPQAIASKPWNTSDPRQCPLSPMTAITTTTNATQNTNNTNNSATPSADTELHANLSAKKQPIAQKVEGDLLTANIADDERDDDDDIDDMEFDFKVAPLSLSKSVQMADIDGTLGAPRGKKESKDPPASLKASESMLPDPGGDESYCSNSSRCESPPPGSVLFEAAARKAESVVGREREQKEREEREELQQQLLKTKELLQQQQEQMQSHKKVPRALELSDNQSRRSIKTCPVPEMKSPRPSRMVQASFVQPQAKPQMETASAPEPVEIIDADAEPRDVQHPGATSEAVVDPPSTPAVERPTVEAIEDQERSKSPPPPVANVNIPNIVKPTNPSSTASVGSHSDSSLTRPPSPSPVGEVTMVEEVSEQRIRDPYGDKGLYTGVLVKRRPHGRGTMKYDDGRHYEGHWNHGRWHGVGRAIFANNDIFEGSYDMDQRHGHGMYQWNDGRVYTGQFFQDQRQGRGTYTWPDGAVYQGEFKAGHRHGQGMYRFADGSVYTGEWENGKYHGVGEVSYCEEEGKGNRPITNISFLPVPLCSAVGRMVVAIEVNGKKVVPMDTE